jgi:hypothetical protein
MRIRDVASLAFAVVGILAFLATFGLIQALVTIPFYKDDLKGNPLGFAVALVVPAAILAGAGVLLIKKRNRLAEALFPDAEAHGDGITLPDLQDLAYSVLGLYLAVSTLPDLGSLAGSLINLRAMESIEQFAGGFRLSVPHYVGTLLELVVGGYLFLYGNRIGAFLRGLHRARRVTPQLPRLLPECPNCGRPYDPTQYRSDAVERLCSGCREPLPSDTPGSAQRRVAADAAATLFD